MAVGSAGPLLLLVGAAAGSDKLDEAACRALGFVRLHPATNPRLPAGRAPALFFRKSPGRGMRAVAVVDGGAG